MAEVEGVDVVRKEKFLRRELDSNFRLFSQPPSIENVPYLWISNNLIKTGEVPLRKLPLVAGYNYYNKRSLPSD